MAPLLAAALGGMLNEMVAERSTCLIYREPCRFRQLSGRRISLGAGGIRRSLTCRNGTLRFERVILL